MKKAHKVVVASLIVFILLSSSVAAQSLIFTDINNHWAKSFIEDIYSRKITSGYQDATFRPDNTLTSLDAISMMANLLGYSSSGHQATADESKVYTSNGIPSWAHGHVSYLVKKGIVEENEVNQFVSNGKINNIKRFIFATYIGKALVEYGGETLSRSVALPYKDDMFIPTVAKPYVDLMLKKAILNKDSNGGEFRPNNEITRAEAAKLISMTAEVLDAAGFNPTEEVVTPIEEVEEEETKEPPTEKKVEEKSGIVEHFVKGNRIVITIKHNNDTFIYDVSKNAVVFLDERKTNIDAIKNGQDVKLKLVDGIVEEIRASGLKEVFSGYFDKLLKGAANTVLTLKDSKGASQVFVIPDDLVVILNDEVSAFANLKSGDIVSLFTKDEKYVELRAKSKTEFVRGTITYLGTPSNPVIEITKADDTTVSLKMETNTSIRRDGRASDFSKLKVSDDAHIELEYDKVKIVNASTLRRKVEGYIRKIVIGVDESYIVVESSDNVMEEFIIADYTTIRMGNEAAEIYDLRLNYFAEINIESHEVVRLETTERVETERYIGIITNIYKEQKILVIEYIENAKKVTKQVNTKSNTIYIGQNGTITFNGLKVGDELLIIGQTDKGLFVAERLVVVVPK